MGSECISFPTPLLACTCSARLIEVKVWEHVGSAHSHTLTSLLCAPLPRQGSGQWCGGGRGAPAPTPLTRSCERHRRENGKRLQHMVWLIARQPGGVAWKRTMKDRRQAYQDIHTITCGHCSTCDQNGSITHRLP